MAHGADVNAAEQWQGQTALVRGRREPRRRREAAGRTGRERQRAIEAARVPGLRLQDGGDDLRGAAGRELDAADVRGTRRCHRRRARAGRQRGRLNLVDPDGTTALTLAIINGHFDAAVALLEKGANPNIADKNGMTALYAAVDMNTIQTVWGRPMPLLEDATDPVGMVRSLLAHGADPNVQLKRPIIGRHTRNTGDASLSQGTTALARAAKSGDARLMKCCSRAAPIRT